jgi:hypothetical protein
LIQDIIPRTGIVVIWGPPKCGKTFKTHDLVMHIALGWPYRGKRVNQGTVVYVAAEGATGVRTRTDAWRQHHLPHNPDQDVPFYMIDAQVDLARDADALIDDIEAELGASAPAVVVIDTLNRTINGSESKDEDMGRFIKAADTIQRAFNCVVIIIHHCGVKSDRPRGHTSLSGANDAQIAIERDDSGLVTMKVEYMKDGEDGTTITSRLQSLVLVDKDGGVLTNSDDEPITSCVVVPADGETASNEPNLTGYANIAYEQLRDLLASGAGELVGSNYIPKNRSSVDVRLWQKMFDNATIKTDGPGHHPDTQRKAWERAWKKLRDLKIIGIWNERAWLTGHFGHRRT